MKAIKGILVGTLFTLGAAYGGLLYLELPPEYPASMVENATAEDEAVLLDFIKNKLATLDNEYADRVVILTKNGEPVYDREGRRLATLAEGHYAAGEHAVSWEADVPTGIYIYRLEAAGKVATRKLVVAK